MEAVMALCWMTSIRQLDAESVFAPERYSAKRAGLSEEMQESVALGEIANLIRATVNPVHRDSAEGNFIVLDTTHAVEGKVLFTGMPIKGREVGSVKRPIYAGNIIVSRLRTYLRQVALIDDDLMGKFDVDDLNIVCSTEFYVLEATKPDQDIAFLVPYLLSE